MPEPLESPRIQLEGSAIEVIETGHTDAVDSTALHVPDLGLVVSGDAAYNHCHMYVGDTTTDGRAEWIAALDRLAELKPALSRLRAQRPHPRQPRFIRCSPSLATISSITGSYAMRGLPDQQLFDAMVNRYPEWVSHTAVPDHRLDLGLLDERRPSLPDHQRHGKYGPARQCGCCWSEGIACARVRAQGGRPFPAARCRRSRNRRGRPDRLPRRELPPCEE